MSKKISKRVADGVQRIANLQKDGKYKEPKRKFETYRTILVDGKSKREPRCFADKDEAIAWHRSTENITTTRGMTLRVVSEKWKQAHKPHVQPSTYENILKVFPDTEDRERNPREYPVDFLMNDEAYAIDPERIDAWFVHIKRDDFIATLKSTKLSFRLEKEMLGQCLEYYASRLAKGEGRVYRPPFLKDHSRMVKFRDAKPKPVKDMPIEMAKKFFAALDQVTEGTAYQGFLSKLAEIQYLSLSRISEVTSLHLEDANTETDEIIMDKSIQYLKRGKQKQLLRDGHKTDGGKIIRSLAIIKLMKDVARMRLIIRGPLFYVDGRPIPYKKLDNLYNKAHRLAGTGQTGTHVIRHASTSEIRTITKNEQETMAVSGHKDPKSLRRYAKVRNEVVDAARRVLEERLSSV